MSEFTQEPQQAAKAQEQPIATAEKAEAPKIETAKDKPALIDRIPREYNFKKGQSGNPSGRPKRTAEEKQLLKDIKGLAPKAYAAMREILESPRVMAMAKVRVIELILNYTLGKPENNVHLTVDPASQVISSETRIAALVQAIQVNMTQPSSQPVLMQNSYTPEQMQRMGLIIPEDDQEENQGEDLDESEDASEEDE